MDKLDKIKESKKKYGKFYNKINTTVQLNRELIDKLKMNLPSHVTIKSYIENLIKRAIQ